MSVVLIVIGVFAHQNKKKKVQNKLKTALYLLLCSLHHKPRTKIEFLHLYTSFVHLKINFAHTVKVTGL